MKAAFRFFAAVLAGLLVLLLLVVTVEFLSAVVHPLPENFGGTQEEMCQHVERYPGWVLALVVPLWAGAACAGAWTARRVGNFAAAAVVALLLLVALVGNISMLPYPSWFKMATLLVIPAATWVGLCPLGRKHNSVA